MHKRRFAIRGVYTWWAEEENRVFSSSQPMPPGEMTHCRLIRDLGKWNSKEPSGIAHWHQRTGAPGFVQGRGFPPLSQHPQVDDT